MKLAILGVLCATPLAAAITPTDITLSTSGVMLVEAKTGEQSETLLLKRSGIDDVLKSFLSSEAALLSLPAPNSQQFHFHSSTGILQQLIGQKAVINGKTGTILTAENAGEVGEVYVTLLVDQSIHRIKLKNLTFSDPNVLKRLQNAAMIAAEQDDDKIPVTINFNKKGSHNIAWLQPAPTWHMAYKLNVIGSKVAVEGWAVLENNTGQDWQNVSLTLGSGKIQALKKQLYNAVDVHRPKHVEEIAGLKSHSRGNLMARSVANDFIAESAPQLAAPQNFQSQQNTTSVSFKIDRPVSLDSGRTISLPILDFRTDAEVLAVYNHQKNTKHPTLQINFKNPLKVGLPEGIATSFEQTENGKQYLGDDTLKPAAADAKARLSVATDMRFNVRHSLINNRYLTDISADEQIIRLKITTEQIHQHRLESTHNKAKKVALEIPVYNLFKPTEKSVIEGQNHWRKTVLVSPGIKTVETPFRHTQTRTLIIDDSLTKRWFEEVNSLNISTDMRQNLKPLQKVLDQIQATQQSLNNLSGQTKKAYEEQARLRENMKVLDRQDDLFLTYKKSLMQQDEKLVKIERQRQTLQQQLNRAKQQLKQLTAKF